MASNNLQKWHDYMKSHDLKALRDMLDDDVVFHSPVVHTPQAGKDITYLYLSAADQVLGTDKFRYINEFDLGNKAVLEFETEVDGLLINGIDMITWNEGGQIVDFKVMVRPLKAINAVHAAMGKMLETLKTKS